MGVLKVSLNSTAIANHPFNLFLIRHIEVILSVKIWQAIQYVHSKSILTETSLLTNANNGVNALQEITALRIKGPSPVINTRQLKKMHNYYFGDSYFKLLTDQVFPWKFQENKYLFKDPLSLASMLCVVYFNLRIIIHLQSDVIQENMYLTAYKMSDFHGPWKSVFRAVYAGKWPW